MRGDAAMTPATLAGYQPETVDSFKVGLKGQFFDRRLSLTTALFQASYDGQQVTSQQVNATGTGIVSFIDNVGKSTIKGAELEATLRLTDTFSLDTALGYMPPETFELKFNQNKQQKSLLTQAILKSGAGYLPDV